MPTTASDLRNPVIAWEVIAHSAVGIIREARASRRLEPLTIDGRMLLQAMAALGIDLEAPKAVTIPHGLRDGLRDGLTDREAEVLTGMSNGKSNADIGRQLYLTEETIKTHARRLYRKLGATDRAHAVALAFRYRLLH